MFHQTPSDTIDADAGKDMGMHLSLSTDVPRRARYLGGSTEVATLFEIGAEIFQDFLVGVLIPANDLAAVLFGIALEGIPASAP